MTQKWLDNRHSIASNSMRSNAKHNRAIAIRKEKKVQTSNSAKRKREAAKNREFKILIPFSMF